MLSVDLDSLQDLSRVLSSDREEMEQIVARVRDLVANSGCLEDSDAEELYHELSRLSCSIAESEESLARNLNRLAAEWEDFEQDIFRSQFELQGKIEKLASSLRGLYFDRSEIKTLMAHDGAVQSQYRLSTLTGAGGEAFESAELQVGAARSLSDLDPREFAPENFDAPVELAGGSSAPVEVLSQHTPVSCGQTSVAMCVNALTGQELSDYDINDRYGFGLLDALNGESAGVGYEWSDGGNLSESSWDLIESKVTTEKTPVIVGLNGPEFSASGRGHIVTITAIEGETVTYADPNTGTLRNTTKSRMVHAPSHPDGNFVFYATAT